MQAVLVAALGILAAMTTHAGAAQSGSEARDGVAASGTVQLAQAGQPPRRGGALPTAAARQSDDRSSLRLDAAASRSRMLPATVGDGAIAAPAGARIAPAGTRAGPLAPQARSRTAALAERPDHVAAKAGARNQPATAGLAVATAQAKPPAAAAKAGLEPVVSRDNTARMGSRNVGRPDLGRASDLSRSAVQASLRPAVPSATARATQESISRYLSARSRVLDQVTRVAMGGESVNKTLAARSAVSNVAPKGLRMPKAAGKRK